MSMQIDERVVKLVFDGGSFSDKASIALDMLGALKKETESDTDISGLEQIANGVDKIAEHFTVLKHAAFNVLTGIAEQAMTTGLSLVKSLSLDQIMQGYGKYVQKTSSIQTIMAATGKSIEEVNTQVERLNWFTDETSYSLTDMTSNIAKFTSNGVELDTAVTAMMGIASAAGLAGAGVQSASHAMEGFSKAIASGKMTLKDWQWIKTARMDTKQFKESLIEAAVAEGTLTKTISDTGDAIYTTAKGTAVDYISFQNTLYEGWATTEAMLKALENYGNFAVELNNVVNETGKTATEWLTAIEAYDDGTKTVNDIAKEMGISVSDVEGYLAILTDASMETSELAFRMSQEAKSLSEAISAVKDAASTRWMQVFETVLGNYEEAKTMWTQLSEYLYDVFVAPLDAVTEAFTLWKENGGRNMLLAGFENIGPALEKIVSPIKDAFAIIFGQVDLYSTIVKITEKFYAFTERLNVTNGTLERIKAIFQGVFATIKLVIKTITSAIKGFKPVISIIGDVLKALFNFAANFGNTLAKLYVTVSKSGFFTTLQNAFTLLTSTIHASLLNFKTFSSIFQTVARVVSTAITGVANVFVIAVNLVKRGVNSIRPLLVKLGSFIGNIGGGILVTIQNITGVLASGMDLIGGLFGNAMNYLQNFSLQRLINELYAVYSFLVTLDLAKIGLQFTDALGNIKSALSAITTNFEIEMFDSFATSMLKLAAAMFIVATIPTDKLLQIGAVILAMAGIVVVATKILSGLGGLGEKLVDTAKETLEFWQISSMMSSMGTMMLKMAVAMYIISQIDQGKILEAGLVMAALMGVIMIAVKFMGVISNSFSIAKSAAGFAALGGAFTMMATSILLLSGVMFVLALIPNSMFLNGIVKLAYMTGFVVAIVYLMKFISGIKALAGMAALTILTLNIFALAVAVAAIGAIPESSIQKAATILLGIVAVMGALTLLASFAMGPMAVAMGLLLVFSVSILIFSSAMIELAAALALMAGVGDKPFAPMYKFVGFLLAMALPFFLLTLISPLILIFAGVTKALANAMIKLGEALAIFAGISATTGIVAVFSALSLGLIEISLACGLCALISPLVLLFAGVLAVLGLAMRVVVPPLIQFGMAWAYLKGLFNGASVAEAAQAASTMAGAIEEVGVQADTTADSLNSVTEAYESFQGVTGNHSNGTNGIMSTIEGVMADGTEIFGNIGVADGESWIDGLGEAFGDFEFTDVTQGLNIGDFWTQGQKEEIAEKVAEPFTSSNLSDGIKEAAGNAAEQYRNQFKSKTEREGFWNAVTDAGFDANIFATVLSGDEMKKLISDYQVYGDEAFRASGKLQAFVDAYNEYIRITQAALDADAAEKAAQKDAERMSRFNDWLSNNGLDAEKLKQALGGEGFADLYSDFWHYDEAGKGTKFTELMAADLAEAQSQIDTVIENDLPRLNQRLEEADRMVAKDDVVTRIQTALTNIKTALESAKDTAKEDGKGLADSVNEGVGEGDLSTGAALLSGKGQSALMATSGEWASAGRSLGTIAGQEALAAYMDVIKSLGGIKKNTGGGGPESFAASGPDTANTTGALTAVGNSAGSAGNAILGAGRRLSTFNTRAHGLISGMSAGKIELKITPVLDMSTMNRQTKDLSNGLSAQLSSSVAGSVRTQGGGNDILGGKIINLNYTQNNTSPKALSRADIYRQTQNQLKFMKGALR